MTHEILLCWAGTIKFDSVWERVLAGLPFSPRLKVRMLTARLDRA